MQPPRAAIAVIGDEILAGHTLDTNSHWIAQRLREAGVELRHVAKVPDDAEEIAAVLRSLLARGFDFVFAIGGIGPTPDDRTYAGVARALEAPLEVRPEHVAWLRDRVRKRGAEGEPWADPERSESMLRMIRLPRDSHALLNPVGAALGCVARTGATSLVVLPGVPAEMRAMYERAFAPVHLKPSEPPAVAEIVTHGQEAALWDVLTDAERAFPRLRFGSYPQEDGHRIVLRVSGPADEVARAREFLTARVPGNQS